MNEYNIYFIDGQHVKVSADDFECDYNKKRVRFFCKEGNGNEINVVVFFSDNIFGFIKVGTE